MTRPAIPNLTEALIRVQQNLQVVPKRNTASVPMKSGGSYSYTYADLGDVTDAVLPLLNAEGIAWTCTPRAGDQGYELVGVLAHVSGEALEGALPLWGRQAQDLGSSITYARRYLLGCMVGVVTDDDDDAYGAIRSPARTRAWSGPSSQEILNRIDAVAARLGITYETVTEKWRTAHGGMTLEEMEAQPPETLLPLAERLEEYAAKESEAAPAPEAPETPEAGAEA